MITYNLNINLNTHQIFQSLTAEMIGVGSDLSIRFYSQMTACFNSLAEWHLRFLDYFKCNQSFQSPQYDSLKPRCFLTFSSCFLDRKGRVSCCNIKITLLSTVEFSRTEFFMLQDSSSVYQLLLGEH